MGTGVMMMDILDIAIGPDTTKIHTGDGPVVIAPDMGNGLDTKTTTKTDATLHTPDAENADTTATADHATDTDTTNQSMPVQARSATQTKQPGSSSKQTSIHPNSPSSSPAIKT